MSFDKTRDHQRLEIRLIMCKPLIEYFMHPHLDASLKNTLNIYLVWKAKKKQKHLTVVHSCFFGSSAVLFWKFGAIFIPSYISTIPFSLLLF